MSGLSIYMYLSTAAYNISPLCRVPENRLPVLEYRPDPRFPLVVLLCVAFTVWWLVERHAAYGWILQDLLGIVIPSLHQSVLTESLPGFAFLTHILSRMLFLPTWVVAVAMVFLFFYDIIMVFITPFLTEVSEPQPSSTPHPSLPLSPSLPPSLSQDHQSVMVKAATGGGGERTEPLPIVFIVPKFLPSALDQTCPELTGAFPYSLLGYGDVGVPGLLVSLALKYDMTFRPASKLRLNFCVTSLGE